MKISVTDFGAIPNDESLQTPYFQKALDYCFFNGGGEVCVPAGNYTIGEIRVRSDTTLHLLENAVINGSKNADDYKYLSSADEIEPLPKDFLPLVTRDASREEHFKNWHNGLILIYQAKNVKIIGEKGSVINGNNVYNPNGEEGYRGPHCITALECENLTFNGYTIKDSSNWSHNTWLCKNVTYENVCVLAGHDGIDFFGSDNVTVKNCRLHTGDDCIAGYDNYKVEISDCELNSSCSAMRFAGTDVTVKHCNVIGPGEFIHRNSLSLEEKMRGANANPQQLSKYRNNMLSFLTYYADKRLKVRHEPKNIVITDCTVKNCDRFLHFNYSGNELWQKQTPLRDITFRNITAENVKLPLNIYGDENNPVSLLMENCAVEFNAEHKNSPMMNAANFDKITLKNVTTNAEYSAAIDCYSPSAGETVIEGGNVIKQFKTVVEFKTDFKTQMI